MILVLILALPGFLYYLLTVKGKNHYHSLSYFGPKKLAGTSHTVKGKVIPDTTYHSIPDFTLTDQNGKTFNTTDLKNKIFVVDFFYSNCPNICSEVNKNLSTLAPEYENNKMVYFLSITVDPQRDTPVILKKYAAMFNSVEKMTDASGDTTAMVKSYKKTFSIKPNWLFLTGDTSTIYPLARNGFLVNALKTTSGDFIYTDKIILVDSHKHIRGYYSGTSDDEITRLDGEIKVQISEELMNKAGNLY